MAEPLHAENGGAASAGFDTRAAAALVIHSVRGQGRSLTDALEALPTPVDARDRPLVHELCYGVLRTLPRQEALAGALLRKPLKRNDRDLEALILVGLYQLTDTRIPPHAAVAATVEATRTLGKAWAAPFVNALLRRFQRERQRLLAHTSAAPQVRWLFPSWLLERLQAAWPQRWQEIVSASNARAPMCLRVNRLRVTRLEYARQLSAAGLTAYPEADAPSALVLDRPVPTSRLPGFAEGLISIQDSGAQLAAGLLDASPGDSVLDACAAPGGKSAHILERAGTAIDLTSVDVDPVRLKRIGENLRRLRLSARIIQGDAASPSGDWAMERYQRILLDVPCSGTGVVRRHPDIKWLRRDSDIAALSRLQARMLDAIWPLLSGGGTLLYATCSLLPQENEEQIRAFLGRQKDARSRPIEASWGIARSFGRQILPREAASDGFYYAALEKAGP